MRAHQDGHVTADTYAAYLSRTLPRDTYGSVRSHLDRCAQCWAAWNRYRWDAAQQSPMLSQLAEFLGSAFRPYFDSSTALAAEWDAANPQTKHETAEFFRNSTSYLYNLVIWQASGNRPDYLSRGIPLLRHNKIRTVLDYGCGIGSDTLTLQHHGFNVIGCDYDSPSTRFLRWRRRDVALVEPSELGQIAQGIDALWIIDTLDHLSDVDSAIGPALSTVQLAITETLATTAGTAPRDFITADRRGSSRSSSSAMACIFLIH